jgi:predicted NBD/HSP70 family sugar kinase
VSPDLIVVGGGVVDNRPDIVPPAVREMEVLLHDFVKSPRVVISQLGRDVGTLGAAAAAWNLVDGKAR